MMATVPHVTSGLRLRKFLADGFLLTRVYELSDYRGGIKITFLYHVSTVTANSGDYSYLGCFELKVRVLRQDVESEQRRRLVCLQTVPGISF